LVFRGFGCGSVAGLRCCLFLAEPAKPRRQSDFPLRMLTPLEKSVLDMVLDKPGEPYDTLKQQLNCATVLKREFTGVGFFTQFAIRNDAQIKRDVSDMSLGGIGAEFPSLKHGAGFVLFIRGGVVATLEGFTYDEDWPENTGDFKLFRTTSTL
jgi:hypothetical protein